MILIILWATGLGYILALIGFEDIVVVPVDIDSVVSMLNHRY